MRILHLIGALIIASSLAACGEDQAAQNAPAPNTPPASQQATPAPPASPASGGNVAATSESRTTGSIGAAGGGADALRAAIGRNFSGGPVTMRLGPENRFTMRDEGGRTVTGRYAASGDIVTFTNPEGDTSGARFPMRCRFEPQPNGAFRLADSDGSCPHFNAVTFAPQG